VDRMAAEATSWVVGRTAAEAAMDGRLLAAVTAWDPEPTHSTAAGIDMTIGARIGTAITGTPIGTAIPTLRIVRWLLLDSRVDTVWMAKQVGVPIVRIPLRLRRISVRRARRPLWPAPWASLKAVSKPSDKSGPRLSGTLPGSLRFMRRAAQPSASNSMAADNRLIPLGANPL
jgi:hypothetical protein